MKNKEKKAPETTTKTIYRIYKITDEGHFAEPRTGNYDGTTYTFDHYNGYPEIKDAQEAIRKYGKDTDGGYAFHIEYVILPIVKLSRE